MKDEMIRARKQCKTCPFCGIDEAERRELALIEAEEFPCHTEQGFINECDIQCRGHWEAQRKYTTLVRVARRVEVADRNAITEG